MASPASCLLEATSDFLAEPQHAAKLKAEIEGFFQRVCRLAAAILRSMQEPARRHLSGCRCASCHLCATLC